MNNTMSVSLPAVTSIVNWAGLGARIQYLDNNNDFPYVKVDDIYNYFAKDESGMYILQMTSLRDLQEEE